MRSIALLLALVFHTPVTDDGDSTDVDDDDGDTIALDGDDVVLPAAAGAVLSAAALPTSIDEGLLCMIFHILSMPMDSG